jgi:hypothetical protein
MDKYDDAKPDDAFSLTHFTTHTSQVALHVRPPSLAEG